MDINRIESNVEEVLKAWQVPGGAVAIVKDGQVVSRRGYGVLELGKPEMVDADTLFPIASCTKSFTAAALGLLVDEGKLAWDDKVLTHLPELTLYDLWVTKEITIRDLLCHRSGLQRAVRLLVRGDGFDAVDYSQRMRYMQPEKGFRTGFGYNNHHFVLAGRIIEAVSGKTWAQFLHERIFEPLGMTSTYASTEKMQQAGVKKTASPHVNKNRDLLPADLHALEEKEPSAWVDLGANPAGSIISTLNDLLKWVSLLEKRGLYNEERLLSEETFAEMTRPQMAIRPGESDMDVISAVCTPFDFLSYGLGWYTGCFRGDKMVFHPGQIYGFVSSIAFLPEKGIYGIVLLNTYHSMAHAMLGYTLFDALQGIESHFSEQMIGMLQGWKAGAEQQMAGFQQPPEAERFFPFDQASLEGEYVSDLYGKIKISRGKQGLEFNYGERNLFRAALKHWQGDTFLIEYEEKIHDLEFLQAAAGEDGQVKAVAIKDVDIFRKL